jgi:hypothetical protein
VVTMPKRVARSAYDVGRRSMRWPVTVDRSGSSKAR